MYYPYFRGKQFELIAIRETAALMAASGFVPIIEPVREAMNGLRRALEAICEANGSAILVVNPDNGDHAGNHLHALQKFRSIFFETFPKGEKDDPDRIVITNMKSRSRITIDEGPVETIRPPIWDSLI
jgi:hypothetical protein